MFHSYKNCNVNLNGNKFLTSLMQVGVENSISPIYLAKDRHTTNYAPENGIIGFLKINYFLTGEDYLKNYIDEEKTVISGNVGGLYFKSGYLKSYNLSCQPNSPVKVDAEIVFFDELKGVFVPTYETISPTSVLNFSDATIIDLANGNIGDISNLLSLNFSFSSDIQPVYEAGESVPKDVSFGFKEISTELVCDILSGDLSIYGKDAALRINFNHPNITGLNESFTASGKLFKRDINVSVGDVLKTSLQIKQNNVNVVPKIISLVPGSGHFGDSVTILGEHLDSTNSVIFNDTLAENFTIIDKYSVSVKVPYEATTGPVSVNTNGGTDITSGNFQVLTYPISITSLSQITGKEGQEISIFGSNFFRINSVKFGGAAASNFRVVNSGFITATVPEDAAWGYISVGSESYQNTGNSPQKFVPLPNITGFSPASGGVGTSISIYGNSFSGVSGVQFNNISATFTVLSNSQISAIVPSGNTKGYIYLYGQSGVSTISVDEFFPIASITGLSKYSGTSGESIQIFGTNFLSSLMYDNASDSKYVVSFGGFTGGFSIINSTTLSGFIPNEAQSGPVNVMTSDGNSYYPSNVSFIVKNGKPVISSIFPHSGKSGDYSILYGLNLFDVSSVYFSGNSSLVAANDIEEGNLGDSISFQTPALTTVGTYSLIVNTLAGSVTGNNIFTLLGSPSISSVSLQSGIEGEIVTVYGHNLYDFSRVFVGIDEAGIRPEAFLANNSRLEFYMPSGSSESGRLIINNSVSSVTGAYIKFIASPSISSFSPGSGQYGDAIIVSGSNLQNVTGVKIGDYSASFTNLGSTGINFTIPNDSQTNIISFLTRGSTQYSSGQLVVLESPVIIGSINPDTVSYGDTLSISGNRLNTAIAVSFSGESGVVNLYDFTLVNNTGLYLTVPSNLIDGKIKISNGSYTTESSQTLKIFRPPAINALINGSGVYSSIVNLSGQNLAGMSFYFLGATGDWVLPLVTTHIGSTGAALTVPREIVSSPILVSGSGQIWGTSSEPFIPLPTVFGFTPVSASNGDYVIVSGTNSVSVAPFLGISGGGNLYDLVDTSDPESFSVDYSRITGSDVISSATGYAVFTIKINTTFLGSGKIFLVPDAFAYLGTATGMNQFISVSSILSSGQLNTIPGAPIVSSFSPVRGNYGTLVTVYGSNFSHVTGIDIVNGGTISGVSIHSQSSSGLTFYPSTGFSAISGQIRLKSPYGTGISTNYFTFINPPVISGFTPTKSTEGNYFLITGSNLDTLTGLYFGEYPVEFDVVSSSAVSGYVPDIENPPQYRRLVGYNEAGSGSSTGFFLIYDAATVLTYKTPAASLVSVPTSTGVLTFAHNLGTTPDFSKIIFTCQSPDLGYVSGDELSVYSITNTSVANTSHDSTYVFIPYNLGGPPVIAVPRKDLGTTANLDSTKWKIGATAYASYYKLPLPATPYGVLVTANDETSITIDWSFDEFSHADGFYVERKAGAGSYSQIADVGPSVRQYMDSGLLENTTYYYRIRAYNANF